MYRRQFLFAFIFVAFNNHAKLHNGIFRLLQQQLGGLSIIALSFKIYPFTNFLVARQHSQDGVTELKQSVPETVHIREDYTLQPCTVITLLQLEKRATIVLNIRVYKQMLKTWCNNLCTSRWIPRLRLEREHILMNHQTTVIDIAILWFTSHSNCHVCWWICIASSLSAMLLTPASPSETEQIWKLAVTLVYFPNFPIYNWTNL